MQASQIIAAINTLSGYLGMRDVESLDGVRADVMVLFGGSILCGGDLLARAMRGGVARQYMIVGGAGHTTQALRDTVHGLYPDFCTDGLPEARVFAGYLAHKYGLAPDLLECESTNCGNNITNMLALMRARGVDCRSIVLCQDATMQRRMDAGLRLHAPGMAITNFATYRARFEWRDGAPVCADNIPGMWPTDRYISLLLGEIPRLTDDAGGYGPRGSGFIAHVDVPGDVRTAFDALRDYAGGAVREANPEYATDKSDKGT